MFPLAITGASAITPLGIGKESCLNALNRGVNGFAVSTEALSQEGPHKKEIQVGEIKGFDANAFLGDKGHRNLDRLTKHLIATAKMTLQDAGIKDTEGNFLALDPESIGVCSSTAYGSLDSITELNLVAELEDPRYINPARFPNTVINAAAGYVSIFEDLRAPNVTIVDGNCGSLDAVLTCETHLHNGRAKGFLVGGGDVLSDPLYVAFEKLGALKEKRLTLGEMSAYLMVEKRKGAEARGANIQAWIAGYGSAFEPPIHEATLLQASPVAVRRAIGLAFADAGIEGVDVDVVFTAASGLAIYDDMESKALKHLCPNAQKIALKSLTGEAFGGSPAFAMVAGTWLLNGLWNTSSWPLTHTEVQSTRTDNPRTVLVLAIGYYGNVSAVILKKHDRLNH